jgi:hypothetical protein
MPLFMTLILDICIAFLHVQSMIYLEKNRLRKEVILSKDYEGQEGYDIPSKSRIRIAIRP